MHSKIQRDWLFIGNIYTPMNLCVSCFTEHDPYMMYDTQMLTSLTSTDIIVPKELYVYMYLNWLKSRLILSQTIVPWLTDNQLRIENEWKTSNIISTIVSWLTDNQLRMSEKLHISSQTIVPWLTDNQLRMSEKLHIPSQTIVPWLTDNPLRMSEKLHISSQQLSHDWLTISWDWVKNFTYHLKLLSHDWLTVKYEYRTSQ